MYQLDTVFEISRFHCLARVREAHLDGDSIVGRLDVEDLVVEVNSPRLWVERLANWGSSSQDILHFTRKYGLLAREGDYKWGDPAFRFRLQFWRDEQEFHRQCWTIFSEQAKLSRE